MNGIVNINGTEISIKEYKGQRVVTFSDIDRVHERPEGTARKRFSDNRERFIEGEDYFVVTPQDLKNTELSEKRTFGIEVTSPRGIALITEQGYLMLVKSFTDDLAWDVQRRLVSSYFTVQRLTSDLSPQLQLMMQMVDQMAQTERQVKEIKAIAEQAVEKTEAIKEAVTPIDDNWRDTIVEKVKRITKFTDKPYKEMWEEMYRALENRAGCDINTRLRNLKARISERGGTKTEINDVRKIDVVESDKRLKEIFSKIVSEYEIRFCV